ncbi:MAG: gluconate:H+ symporter [Sporolactobacillus sp.]
MPLILVSISVVVLLLLIMKFNMNTFISLLIVSILLGLALNIPLPKLIPVIEKGIGDQLGELVLIFGLGAILGRLVTDAGGAHQIAGSLARRFGRKRIQIAVVLASFIVGIALFFEVGLVLLLPIIAEIGLALDVPLLYVGMPMVAALMTTHGFLPPHPAPTALVQSFHANMAHVLIAGIAVAIPTVVLGGILLNRLLYHLMPSVYAHAGSDDLIDKKVHFDEQKLPSLALSILTCLLPVILMILTTILTGLFSPPPRVSQIIRLAGSPPIAMIISVLFAIYSMGIRQHRSTDEIEKTVGRAIRQIAMLLLIIGAGGALKQVMIDGGVGDYVAHIFKGTPLPPLILSWVITVLLRTAIGSSTVAALTAAGIVSPMVAKAGINPTFIVLATGAGSVFCGHVNDPGFWLFKEYFDVSLKETFKTYTLLGCTISVIGIVCIYLLSLAF